MTFVLQSLPKKSSQLRNKNASSLIKFFESDAGVLYLYGPAGSGKTTGVEILAREFGYELIYAEPPFDIDKVSSLSACSLFLSDKKMIVVDIGVDMKADILKILAEGFWGETRLVIIGTTYAKANPMRRAFKDRDYKFVAIKFYQFDEMDVVGCLSMYAAELGARVSYDTLVKIAKEAAGDMRSARMSLRLLITSGYEDAVDCFLPVGETAYFNNLNKLFGKNIGDVESAIEYFGPYLILYIIRNNLMYRLPDRMDFMEILKDCNYSSVDLSSYIVDLAYIVGRNLKGVKHKAYKKAKKISVPDIEVNCSDVKKIMHYRGFHTWQEKKD